MLSISAADTKMTGATTSMAAITIVTVTDKPELRKRGRSARSTGANKTASVNAQISAGINGAAMT